MVSKVVPKKTKSKSVNKVKALMDYFGYSRKEAVAMLKDMGE